LENVGRDIKWVGESFSQLSLMEDELLLQTKREI